MTKLEELLKIISNSNHIVFFGGAGVSVASGIPDFRGANGLYQENPEEIVSHSYFLKNPNKFYNFYFSKMVYKDALPNECHKALSYLEKIGKLRGIITQNIDGLHQKAGSKKVLELHGSIWNNHSVNCKKYFSLNELKQTGIPRCPCGGIIKPDVVLYEENLDETVINQSIELISSADTLIIAGTSLVVYPAANFIRFFKGKNLVYINLGVENIKKQLDIPNAVKQILNQSNAIIIDGKVEDYLNIKNFEVFK